MGIKFEDLGIPFPLFEAVTDEASEYVGIAACSLCRKEGTHCFSLGIGAAVMVDCSHCGEGNGLDADDRQDVACHSCGEDVPFPEIDDEEMRVCYGCLRAGRVALSKDTAFGMVSWEQVVEGLTHGGPRIATTEFETVSQGQRGWVKVKLPTDLMLELLRTPAYLTWQGERWQFCCKQPMVYTGPWKRDDFESNAPDGDGRALFEKVVQEYTAEFWDQGFSDCTGIYVFKCNSCQRLTAHVDCE